MKSRYLLYIPLLVTGIFLVLATAGKQRPDADIADIGTDPWKHAYDIVDRVQPPVFPNVDFSITDYGAKGNGLTNDLPAIAAAIEDCHEKGGGRVVIPSGKYVVNGPIHLRSNINLHLEEGALVLFSTDPSDYLPVVFTRWQGIECYNYSPLVYAFEQENVAITGKGVLDGQASSENWWSWCGSKRFGWKEGMPSNRDELSGPRVFDWNTREVPVEQRVLGAGSYIRPNFIQIYRCKNVLIEDVTIRNSPMWVVHPVVCENVIVDGIRVISHGPNSDGCDPESCRNVIIRNCYFDTGDDCIALKSGRNQDGRRVNRPIENVVIQNCEMKDGHGGVVIGSEVSGGARHIYAEDCYMGSPNLDRALRIKTNKIRGGTVEHIYFRNVKVDEVKESVVRVNMHYTISSDPNQYYPPVVQNIFVDNVTSKKSKHGVMILGMSEEHPVRNVVIRNCNFNGVEAGNVIEYEDNLILENVLINGEQAE